MDCTDQDERFLSVKDSLETSIRLEREGTKRLTLKILFTGDGSRTKNVRRIW